MKKNTEGMNGSAGDGDMVVVLGKALKYNIKHEAGKGRL